MCKSLFKEEVSLKFKKIFSWWSTLVCSKQFPTRVTPVCRTPNSMLLLGYKHNYLIDFTYRIWRVVLLLLLLLQVV